MGASHVALCTTESTLLYIVYKIIGRLWEVIENIEIKDYFWDVVKCMSFVWKSRLHFGNE